MKKYIFLVLTFGFGLTANAGLSPLRPHGYSYETAKMNAYLIEASSKHPSKKHHDTTGWETAERSKMALNQLEFSSAPEVTMEQLLSIFNYIRDSRFMKKDKYSQYDRRLTWLFPDDGCYARAAVAAYNIPVGTKQPNKLFIFGNLNAETPNTLSGEVDWWYHVAIVYQVEGQLYVIDPALSPSKPLTASEWGRLMVPDLTYAKFSLCDSNTYDPSSRCHGSTEMNPEDAYREQSYFLPLEWTRVEELGRDPIQVLIEQTFPWFN